jgi:eukaryotic-like serine/threonine-protein kinase
MGIVYAAQDERLDRLVALKVISDAPDDEVVRKRFWREARAAARVNHPNIASSMRSANIARLCSLRWNSFRASLWLTASPAGSYLFSEAIRIGLDMLAALDALHAQGIVHRDLKPSNVFLATHAVKLLDFGLAKATDPPLVNAVDETTGPLTQPGVIMGTPRYMSPEQVRGCSVDTRTDVFAAGAILFEMLSGEPAFAGAKMARRTLRTPSHV